MKYHTIPVIATARGKTRQYIHGIVRQGIIHGSYKSGSVYLVPDTAINPHTEQHTAKIESLDENDTVLYALQSPNIENRENLPIRIFLGKIQQEIINRYPFLAVEPCLYTFLQFAEDNPDSNIYIVKRG